MTTKEIKEDNFEQYILNHPFKGEPENLYEAMNYIMQLGGKRMRPKLLLLAYKFCNGQNTKNANQLALAIETFHNFSLVHDDIMDNAPLRRGKQTVHEVYNQATAVLTGDNLFIKCFDLILQTEFKTIELLDAFTKMASLVCDGQQMDMNLPEMKNVSEKDYLKMIELKTAVLPACAMKMGAIAANASKDVCDAFYQFGLNLGMAFQLQDDYLDSFGTADEIGKQEGGDIIENKKTILYLHAESQLEKSDLDVFNQWFHKPVHDVNEKLKQVRALYIKAKSDTYLKDIKNQYEEAAIDALKATQISTESQKELLDLLNVLSARIK